MKDRSFWWWITSSMPLVIVIGLLYAALYVKPTSSGAAVPEPVLGKRDHIYGVSSAVDGTIVAVGADGKILKGNISEGAASIKQISTGNRETLQAVDRWSAEKVVAVGNEGVIQISDDGGNSWENVIGPKSPVANRLVKVKAIADGIGFAVGEYNALLKTRDFGTTWKRMLPDKDKVIYGIDASGSHMIAVGEFGRILTSTDQGDSWKEIPAPTNANLTAVAFGQGKRAVAVGLNGTVLVSDDFGANWSKVSAGVEDNLYDISWNNGQYLAVGDRGTVIISKDGATWTHPDTALGNDANYLWFMQAIKVNSHYIAAGSGVTLMDENFKATLLQ